MKTRDRHVWKKGNADAMESYLLGIDIGTQGSKGILVTTNGRVVSIASREHGIAIPRSGWAEHDADQIWWADFVTLCRALLDQAQIDPRRILAVGPSGLSPDMLPLDAHGRPLRPAILYGIDTRATKQIAAINAFLASSHEQDDARVRVTHQHVGPKLLWFRDNEPDRWSRTAKVVSAHGYIVYKLTGAYTLDYGTASGFAPFYDPQVRRWREDRCAALGIPVHLLPDLVGATDVAGTVQREAALVTGLAAGTPVIAGVTDFMAELISTGTHNAGDIVLSYGSTMSFMVFTQGPVHCPGLWGTSGFTHDLFPAQWTIGGGMATSASLIRWFRDNFAAAELEEERAHGINAYQLLSREAASLPFGSDGLIVLPYFSGERTPIHDPRARGMVFGLTLKHTRSHIYRAILEGISYGLKHHLDLIRDAGVPLTRIAAVGGGTRNPLWTRIVTDVTNLPQDILLSAGAPLGDAYLAGYGIGLFHDFRAIHEHWIRVAEVIQPDPTAHARYAAYYPIYRALYERTKEEMHMLDRLCRGEAGEADAEPVEEEVSRIA